MNDAPAIGHNKPPPDPFERAAALIANANRWSKERPTITDAEMAGVAQEFVIELRRNKEALEKAMKAEREPHDIEIGMIRLRYRDPLALVGLALSRMAEKLAPWLTREQNRLDLEAQQRRRAAAEAARRAEEALAKAEGGTVEAELAAQRALQEQERARKAAAKPVERARAKGDLAPRAMTMRTTHYAEVVDEVEALRSFADEPSVRAAALEAATKLASKIASESKGDVRLCPRGFEFRKRETPV